MNLKTANTADNTSFDNTSTGLLATTVEEAIGELASNSSKTSFYFKNTNFEYKQIAGIAYGQNTGEWFSFCEGYVYFTDWDNGSKISRIKPDGTGYSVISSSQGTMPIAIGTEVFYKHSLNRDIYKCNLDGTGETVVYVGTIYELQTDGTYIYFKESGNIKRILPDGTGLQTIYDLNSVSGWHVEGSYVFIRPSPDYYLYRCDLDGANLTQLTNHMISAIRIYGTQIGNNAIFYNNQSVGKLARVNLDGTNQQDFTINGDYITILGDKVYFRNSDDNFYLYEMNFDGTGLKKVVDNTAIFCVTANDKIAFISESFGIKLYFVDPDIPEGYSQADGVYEEEIINTSQNIAIQVHFNTPTDTDFTFEIANEKTLQTLIEEGDWNIDVCCGTYSDMSWSYDFTTMLNPGDTITLFKTGSSDEEVIVTSVNTDSFNFTPDVFCCTGGVGIRSLQSNYTIIPNNQLNGITNIDLDSLFSSATNDLYYRLTLSSTDQTKTPTINVVEILK